jgi:radical SAM protein with 4Fe4S-binding SPASM domain
MDNKPAFSQFRAKAFARTDLASKLPLAAPYAMFVEFTNRCNFRCTFCPESLDDYSDKVGGTHVMSEAVFHRLCNEILALGRLRVLRFHMLGEPLLHKRAPEMIAHAVRLNVADRTELTTNGSAITDKVADALVKSGLDYIRFSIYAMNPERHKRIIGTAITPEKVRQGVEALRRARERNGGVGPFIYAKMINPFDPQEEAAFRETYTGLADEVMLEEPMNWNDESGVDFISASYEKPVDREPLFPMRKEVCPLPFYTLVVHSDGAVGICCVDWAKQTIVGNLTKESLTDVWRGEKLRAFQTMHLERRANENLACKGCTYPHTIPDNIDVLRGPEDLWPRKVSTVV